MGCSSQRPCSNIFGLLTIVVAVETNAKQKKKKVIFWNWEDSESKTFLVYLFFCSKLTKIKGKRMFLIIGDHQKSNNEWKS